jgi:hypothetical protein
MAATQSGSAFSSYSLEISGVRTAVTEARKLIQQLRQEASKPLPKLTQSSNAVSPQTVNTTNKAALAQQKLATEQQRTNKTAIDASVSQQRLATEQQRTAATAAQAEKNQLALAAAQRRAAQSTKNNGLGPALPRTIDGLSGSALTAAKAFISLQAAQKGLEFIKLGAESADARKALDGLAASAGTTKEALLTNLRAAADGTIRDIDLIKSANLGLLLTNGRIAKDLPQLITIARASAKATGQDINFVYDSLVRGIARGSPKIIDNAGITLDAAGAFEKYAKSIGKSADQLTGAEQQQATLNAVLETGAQIVKDVGLDANSSAVNIARATTAVQNLGEALSSKIAPFLGGAAGGIANLLNAGEINPGTTAQGDQLQGGLINKAKSYDQYAASVTESNDKIKEAFKDDPVGGILAKQLYGLQALTPVEFAYAQGLIQTGTAREKAIADTKAHGDALRELNDFIGVASAGNEELRNSLIKQAPVLSAVATGTEDEKTAVYDLIAAYANGEINGAQFSSKLTLLAQAHEAARQAALEEAHEQRTLNRTFEEAKGPVVELKGALADEAIEAEKAKVKSQELNDVQSALASIGGAVKSGLITSAQGAIILATNLQLPIDKARELLNLQAQIAGKQAAVEREVTRATVTPLGKKDIDSFGLPTAQDKQQSQQILDAAKETQDARLAAAKAAAAEQKRIADAQFNLELTRATTNAQKIALYKRKLAQTTDKAEQLNLQAQIASLQQAKEHAGGGSDAKGLGALAQDDIKLAGDLQSQLDVVNAKLARGNLTQHQRNQLLIEQRDLQAKIREETEKQLEAQIDSQIGLIQDRQARRQEAREIAALQRALARPNLTGERRAAVEDQLALVQLQQNQRALRLNQQVAAAGGDPNAVASVTPINVPNAGVSAVSGAPVSAQGQATSFPTTGPVTLNFQFDSKNFATAIAPSLYDLLVGKPIRLQAARGG